MPAWFPKKLTAAVAIATLSYFALKSGMSAEDVALITGPLYAYIVGQGLADFGKERAKVEVRAEKEAKAERVGT